jgi:hypothetical protein
MVLGWSKRLKKQTNQQQAIFQSRRECSEENNLSRKPLAMKESLSILVIFTSQSP